MEVDDAPVQRRQTRQQAAAAAASQPQGQPLSQEARLWPPAEADDDNTLPDADAPPAQELSEEVGTHLKSAAHPWMVSPATAPCLLSPLGLSATPMGVPWRWYAAPVGVAACALGRTMGEGLQPP